MNWSKPYYCVQHSPKTNRRWCTVRDKGDWAELLRWFEGCQFSPLVSHHDTTAEARAAGERWLQDTP